MISRWIERISVWKTRRRFSRWHKRYRTAAAGNLRRPEAATLSTWEAPSEPHYARSSFERNILGGGKAVNLQARFDTAAVRDLVRIIQAHPARKDRRLNPVVDDYIYSMF